MVTDQRPRTSPGPTSPAPQIFDRTPPQHLDAEVAVLGAALLSRSALAEVVELVRPEDFYRTAHRRIYEAVLALFGAGEVIDPITIVDKLGRTGVLDDVGGASAIHDLVAAVPTAANAVYYARIVREKAILRRLIEAGTQVVSLGYEGADDINLTVDRAEQLIYDVAQGRVSSEYSPLRELLSEGFARIEQRYENRSEVTGLPTGLDDFDRLTAGLQPQNLIIIAARPSVGKSSLALTMVQYVTVELRKPVVLFSLEMSKGEIVDRMLSSEARIDSLRVRTGRLDDADWASLSDAMGRLADAPLFIDDTPSITLMEIRSKCRRLKQRHGLELVVIDYLQLMSGGTRAENRQQEVSEISRGCKMLAKELELPVIALSQLSRQPEARSDKRPMLADLRESGCLTGDTRIVRADTGEPVTLADLHAQGERDIPVWTLDDRFRLVQGNMTHVFSSGVKRVFDLRLASGRTIRASGNHPFLAFDGWRRLDELQLGERIAVPRTSPQPTGGTAMDRDEIVLLAHLIGDGCAVARQPLHYTSADEANRRVVEEAAARRFGIRPRRVAQSTWEHVYLPAPHRLTHGRRNPVAAWLDDLGLFDRRSYEKFLPPVVFGLPREGVALFLRHLWATDGTVYVRRIRERLSPCIYYATSSPRLAADVQMLLLRLELNGRIVIAQQHGYRPMHHVYISGKEEQELFLTDVGVHGARGIAAIDALATLEGVVHNPNVDTVPRDVWRQVRSARVAAGMTERDFQAAIGTRYCGTSLYRSDLGRARLGRVAGVLDEPGLTDLAHSDVLWDRVTSITHAGEEEVFDATVPGTHNFVADGIVVHNSLEQDSDIVSFIYRDEVYDPDSPDRGVAELIVAKHRNGPTGVVKLAFLDHLTKFANLARTRV